MNRLRGTAAAEGIAIGPAFVLDRRRARVPQYHLQPEQVHAEQDRFRAALARADEQLARVQGKLADAGGDSLILEAHRLILGDEHLVDGALSRIEKMAINAEWALQQSVADIKRVFDAVDDAYFRQRGEDVVLVARQLQLALQGAEEARPAPPRGAVVVARDLSPAEAVQFHRSGAVGFVTDGGGRHLAHRDRRAFAGHSCRGGRAGGAVADRQR